MLQTKKFTFICVPKSNTGTTNFNIEDIETIGQFTGLYDKNKVPIYEGDIVELKANNGCCDMTGQIIFDEYDLAYELRDIETGEQECMWYAEQELEVIGNIYDNPDLLGE